MSDRACVTCGEQVGQERWDIGFRYCMEQACVRENHNPLVIVEIAQTKTNPVITTATPETLRAMRDGRFRRDPVVVTRQPSNGEKVRMRATPAKPARYDIWRVRFVQALHDQGYSAADIFTKGAYMGLTRREIHQYMAMRRI